MTASAGASGSTSTCVLRTISEIVRQLQHENHISEMGDVVDWIRNLFVCGLVGLQEV